MPSLSLVNRRLVPEKMDAQGLSPTLHHQALVGLQRINRASGAALAIWRPIHALCVRENLHQLTLLDIATGAGDVPVSLAQIARRHGIGLRITAIDRSPTAIEHAHASAHAAGLDIRFLQGDALADPWPGDFDIVTCSLFLHHLGRDDCITFLRKMAAARRLIVVSDLRRSALGYAVAWVGCRLLSRSPVVHYDGPVSVAAAWSPRELHHLAREARLPPPLIRRCWPWRMLLTCRTDQPATP